MVEFKRNQLEKGIRQIGPPVLGRVHVPARRHADEDLHQVRRHLAVVYFRYRCCTDSKRQALLPASEEYYLAQARMADDVGSLLQPETGDELPQEPRGEIHELRCSSGY